MKPDLESKSADLGASAAHLQRRGGGGTVGGKGGGGGGRKRRKGLVVGGGHGCLLKEFVFVGIRLLKYKEVTEF